MPKPTQQQPTQWVNPLLPSTGNARLDGALLVSSAERGSAILNAAAKLGALKDAIAGAEMILSVAGGDPAQVAGLNDESILGYAQQLHEIIEGLRLANKHHAVLVSIAGGQAGGLALGTWGDGTSDAPEGK